MKVVIGADHRGADILNHLGDLLVRLGHEVNTNSRGNSTSCDYPDIAFPVALAVARREADRGILLCGSGIGMCIAANKVKGVRAALVHDEIAAEVSRRHNDANILCMAADMLGVRFIDRIVQTWLRTEFEGGRHARRVGKIAAIEQGVDPITLGNGGGLGVVSDASNLSLPA